ncbi:MAG: LacI family DNA-binding transcriptional regulator [Kiritimatiellia bacterium]|jgi:LacI family transcriptional regulator
MKPTARNKTATVKDVAKACGLSLSSVIHILGGREQRYREETCRLVKETARRLGYRRNSSARAMRSGRFDCITLLMSAHPDTTLLHQAAIEGICDALAEHDMHLNVARLPNETLEDASLVPKLLREWTADGLLVAIATHIPPDMVDRIAASRLPCVWIRSKLERDCVYLDEADAARKAVDHLLGLGHRRIAFADYTFGSLSKSAGHYGIVEFEDGYCRRMSDAGLAPRVIRESDRVERSDRVGRWVDVLSKPRRPTAVVASVSTALPLMTAALTLGLRIPDDLSIITQGDRVNNVTGITLTTLTFSEHEIGRQSAAMLVQRIRGGAGPLPPVLIQSVLEAPESCAPPRKEGKKERT